MVDDVDDMQLSQIKVSPFLQNCESEEEEHGSKLDGEEFPNLPPHRDYKCHVE